MELGYLCLEWCRKIVLLMYKNPIDNRKVEEVNLVSGQNMLLKCYNPIVKLINYGPELVPTDPLELSLRVKPTRGDQGWYIDKR